MYGGVSMVEMMIAIIIKPKSKDVNNCKGGENNE